MRLNLIGWGTLVLLLGVTSGCSSGAKYKVDAATVADLPLGEQGELRSWQADRDRALGEENKARADVNTADHSVATAQAERGQARLATQKVTSDLDLAKPRRDVARLSRLQSELSVAKLAEDAAETRLQWCKQKRKVSEAQVSAAMAHTRLAEARVEQARAHLAERHGRLPSSNHRVATFDRQAAQAEQDKDKEQQKVAAEASQSSNLEKEYASRLSEYSQRRSQLPGFSSSYTPPGYVASGESMSTPQAQLGYAPIR